jgi:hypothetical protein
MPTMIFNLSNLFSNVKMIDMQGERALRSGAGEKFIFGPDTVED